MQKKLIFVLNAVDIDPTAAANEKFVLSHNYDVSLSNCNPPTTTHTNKKSVFNVKFFVWLRNAINREKGGATQKDRVKWICSHKRYYQSDLSQEKRTLEVKRSVSFSASLKYPNNLQLQSFLYYI